MQAEGEEATQSPLGKEFQKGGGILEKALTLAPDVTPKPPAPMFSVVGQIHTGEGGPSEMLVLGHLGL